MSFVQRVATVLAAVAVALGVVAVVTRVSSDDNPHRSTVRASPTTCTTGTRALASGRETLAAENHTDLPYDVALMTPDARTIYADIANVPPHGERATVAAVPPGSYKWRCTSAKGDVSFSSKVVVRGRAIEGARPFVPVTYAQLASAAAAFRREIDEQLPTLVADVDALQSDIRRGDLEHAKQSWLLGHMEYERLGAAYTTFGDLDDQINGRPDGLPGGVHDEDFTGFGRIEYGLWTGQTAAQLAPAAAALDRTVHTLATAFPVAPIPPNDVALRSHEILENALQFELTAQTDLGSHTNLATVRANVDGTRLALTAVAPLLQARDPALLHTVSNGLDGLAVMLDTYRHSNGSWTPVQALTRAQHQRLDAAVSGLVEQLSPIPDLLQVQGIDAT